MVNPNVLSLLDCNGVAMYNVSDDNITDDNVLDTLRCESKIGEDNG